MTDLEEAGDPIEDIKKAMKSLEDRGIYHPNDGKFKISKEQLELFTKETKKEIQKVIREKWGLEKAIKNYLSKEFGLDDNEYELVWNDRLPMKSKDETTLNTED